MPVPKKKLTPEQLEMIETMAGYGVPQKDIAATIGIDPKTMRRHYSDRLAAGMTKANQRVAESLFEQATRGNVTAAIFWAKTRMGWKETNVTEHTGKDGGAIEIENVRSRVESQLGRLSESRKKDEVAETVH